MRKLFGVYKVVSGVEDMHHSPLVLFGGVAEDLIVNLWRIEKCAGLRAGLAHVS
jgi:hypothetical protein